MKPLRFRYKNHNAKIEERSIIPLGAPIWGKFTPYYNEDQWLLRGYDLDRKDERVFAMAKMQMLQPADVRAYVVDDSNREITDKYEKAASASAINHDDWF